MFTGSIVALVTPMDGAGHIDWSCLERLIEWHIEQGSNALVAVGTTGESATLEHDEHERVMAFCVSRAAGRIPIIAGAGGNSTSEAVSLSQMAYCCGAAATLQVVPYYNKPPQRALIAHFTRIAESCPLPHILYNVPGRTSCDLLPETVLELAKVDNIIGIKEASTLQRLRELKALLPDDFSIFTGEDGNACQAACEALVKGVISVTANVAPAAMSAMMRAALAGKREEAEAINQTLSALHRALFLEANPIPVKFLLNAMGKIPQGIRLPLLPLDETHRAALLAAATQAHLAVETAA